MSMVRKLFYRLAFERDQKRRCQSDNCAVISPSSDLKGYGFCHRCRREYLWIKTERIWQFAGTYRPLVR